MDDNDTLLNKLDGSLLAQSFRLVHAKYLKDISQENTIANQVFGWITTMSDNISYTNLEDFLNEINTDVEGHNRNDEESKKEVNKLKLSENIEPKNIKIKNLTIKNFRRFQEEGQIFNVPSFDSCSKQPLSLFLIGSNGIGKSSIYSAYEWIMNNKISEGLIRGRKFQDPPYRDAPQPIITLEINGENEPFSNYQNFEKAYRGNLILAVFCSETDITDIGKRLNEEDNSLLFAELMGYNDLTNLHKFLRLYEQKLQKRIGKDYDAEKGLVEKEYHIANKELNTAVNEIIENFLSPSMDKSKESLFLRNARSAVDRIQSILELDKLNDKEVLEQLLIIRNELNRNINNYVELTGNQELINKLNKLSACVSSLQSPSSSLMSFAPQLQGEQEDKIGVAKKYLKEMQEALKAPLKAQLRADLGILKDSLLKEVKAHLAYDDIKEREKLKEKQKQVQDYRKALEDKIKDIIKEKYEGYSKLLKEVMKDFMQPNENFILDIGFDENKFKIRLKNTEENEGEKVYKYISPTVFYNNFRYKLFCLLLKILGGIAYMNINKICVPIILDDVFYGSDFYSRTKIKNFFTILFQGIKQNVINEDVQIICFTHDEIVLNAIAGAVRNTNYQNVLFGRLMPSKTIISIPKNEYYEYDESNKVYVDFYQHIRKKNEKE